MDFNIRYMATPDPAAPKTFITVDVPTGQIIGIQQFSGPSGLLPDDSVEKIYRIVPNWFFGVIFREGRKIYTVTSLPTILDIAAVDDTSLPDPGT